MSTDSVGDVCGSVLWTSGETTSIAVWGAEAGEEYGLEAGENITWIISTEDGDVVGQQHLALDQVIAIHAMD